MYLQWIEAERENNINTYLLPLRQSKISAAGEDLSLYLQPMMGNSVKAEGACYSVRGVTLGNIDFSDDGVPFIDVIETNAIKELGNWKNPDEPTVVGQEENYGDEKAAGEVKDEDQDYWLTAGVVKRRDQSLLEVAEPWVNKAQQGEWMEDF